MYPLYFVQCMRSNKNDTLLLFNQKQANVV